MSYDVASRGASDLAKAGPQSIAAHAAEGRSGATGAQPARRAGRLAALGLYVFAASVPLDMLPVIGETFGLTRVTGLLLAVTALTQPKVTLRRPPAPFWWFGAYVIAVFISGVPHLDAYPSEIALRVLTLTQVLVMFWIVYNLLRDDVRSARALLVFAMACGVVALLMSLGVYQTSIATARGVRLSFAGGNANQVGTTLMLGLLTLVGLGYTARLAGRWWKWVVPIFAVPVAYAVMDTGSRGAVAGLGGGLLVLAFSGEHVARRLRNLLVFTVVGAAVYFAVYTTYISRVRWEEALEHRKISGRERIYPALLGMAAERPIQGWGAEKNRRELAARVPQMEEISLDAHNLYLHVLTEVGILGSLPILVALALSLQAARRAVRTRHGLLPLVLLCSVLVASLASTWILGKPFWFFMAYAVAAGADVGRVTRRRRLSPAYPLPSEWVQSASGGHTASDAP